MVNDAKVAIINSDHAGSVKYSLKRALNDFYYYSLMLNDDDLQDYLDLSMPKPLQIEE